MSSGSVDCYTVISAVDETARTRDKEEAQGAVGVAIRKRLAYRALLRACGKDVKPGSGEGCDTCGSPFQAEGAARRPHGWGCS